MDSLKGKAKQSAELGFVYQEVACFIAIMKGPGQPRAFTVNGAWAPNPEGFYCSALVCLTVRLHLPKLLIINTMSETIS